MALVLAHAAGDHDAGFPPKIVGRLHPLLVHLPIGWVLLAFGAEAWAMLRKRAEPVFPALSLLVLSVAATGAAIVTGLVLAREEAPEDLPPVHFHRNVAFAMSAFLVAAALVRWKARGHGARIAYLVLLAVSALLLFGAAHLGAGLVHGDDYLFPE